MRREADFFGDREMDLVYIAKKLQEALQLESAFAESGVDYAVEPDKYSGGVIFRSERVGAFFYVLPEAADQARLVMRVRHHLPYSAKDDFAISGNQTFLDLWASISQSFFAVTIGIASISLLVGGIVVMNIMLVPVTERTREIGVRKALGARRHDIMIQFLIESATLSLVGGLIGITLGSSIALAVAEFTPLPAVIKWWAIALAIVVSTGVGLFFGIYPANKAANLDPIVALRYE